MTNNHQIIDDKELQTFFDSPLIDRDCSNINRCKAVLSKIKNLVSFNQNIDYKIKNFILIDNIISSLLSHTIANVSDPNIPIGIIEYSESVETGEDFNYKILPCSEIMSIIEHHVKEDTNGRIIRIHTRHGNLLVPSFNRADTEQHIEKKKEHLREKLREKLKRKEIRLEMFLNACNLFLTNDKSKLSILDKSEKIDSEIVTWTTNFVSKIIYPKKYPDFFMCRKRKQTATKQTADTHIIKIPKTNEENLVDADKSKGINANEKNLVDVDKNKGINANDVSKMIQSIHSSSDNAIAIEKPATQSANLHEKKILTSVESIDTSNNQIDSHQSSYNILPSTDIEGKVKLSRNERRKLARIRLFNMKNEDKTPAETPDPGGHNLHLQVKPSHEHMSRNHLSTTGEIQKMPSNSMNYYLESGDKVYKERLCINLPENALMQHDDKFSRHQIALVEGDHYACWFDSQHVNSKFCYLKVSTICNFKTIKYYKDLSKVYYYVKS